MQHTHTHTHTHSHTHIYITSTYISSAYISIVLVVVEGNIIVPRRTLIGKMTNVFFQNDFMNSSASQNNNIMLIIPISRLANLKGGSQACVFLYRTAIVYYIYISSKQYNEVQKSRRLNIRRLEHHNIWYFKPQR